jgi:hypothetical protein
LPSGLKMLVRTTLSMARQTSRTVIVTQILFMVNEGVEVAQCLDVRGFTPASETSSCKRERWRDRSIFACRRRN